MAPPAKPTTSNTRRIPVTAQSNKRIGDTSKNKNNKKKKKGKKKLKLLKTLPTEEAEVVPQRPSKPGWASWPGGDFIVMFILWSLEGTHVVYDAMKLATHSLTFAHSLALMIVTCLATLAIGYVSTGWAFKYWIVACGLCIYLIGGICGILFAQRGNEIFSTLCNWLQVAWYAVNPLRYFLIFHQRWPMLMYHTRFIVAVNVSVVGLAAYISARCVRQAKHLDYSLVIVWGNITVIMLVYLVGLHLVHFLIMEKPTNIHDISELYKHTSANSNYIHRHKNHIIFIILLIPCVIFVPTAQFATVAISKYENDLFSIYRFDLVLMVIIMFVSKTIFTYVRLVRNEMEDLFMILVAHIFNLIALGLFIVAALRTDNNRMSIETPPIKRWNEHEPLDSYELVEAQSLGQLTAYSYLIFSDEWSSHTFMIQFDNISPIVVMNSSNYLEIPVHPTTLRIYRCRGLLVAEGAKRVVFDDKIELDPYETRVFYSGGESKPLVNVPTPQQVRSNEMEQVILFYNLVDTCNPPNNGLKFFDGSCVFAAFDFKCYNNDHNPRQTKKVVFSKKNGLPEVVKCPYKKFEYKFECKEQDFSARTFSSQLGQTMIVGVTADWNPGKYSVFHLIMKNHLVLETNESKSSTVAAIISPSSREAGSSGPGILIILGMLVAAIGIGAAQVSYIHFFWTFSPFKGRAVYIAGYLTWIYFSQWASTTFLDSFNFLRLICIFALQVVFIVVHFLKMFLFESSLPLVSETRKNERYF